MGNPKYRVEVSTPKHEFITERSVVPAKGMILELVYFPKRPGKTYLEVFASGENIHMKNVTVKVQRVHYLQIGPRKCDLSVFGKDV
jgi:hypothetical protein